MTRTGKWVLGGIAFFFALFIIFWGAILLVFLSEENDEESTGKGKGKIAIVEINEAIVSSENVVRQIKKFRENSSIDGILLRINSPGGDVTASQEMYHEVRKTRESGMPIVVSMGSVAASGGYYVACGATRIVANEGTITGSIGVITQLLHYNQLMDKLGLSSTTITTGKMKDAGSPFRQPTAEEKEYFQQTVNDIFDQFIAVVVRERKLTPVQVKQISDGRIFSGVRARQLGLVDTLGTFEDAVDIVADLAGIGHGPTLVREKRKRESISDIIFGGIADEVRSIKKEFFNSAVIQYKMMHP